MSASLREEERAGNEVLNQGTGAGVGRGGGDEWWQPLPCFISRTSYPCRHDD